MKLDFRLYYREQFFADFLQDSLWCLTYETWGGNIVLFTLRITHSSRKVSFCMLSGLGETRSPLLFTRWQEVVSSIVVIKFNLPRDCRDYSFCYHCKKEGPNILFSVNSIEI